MENYSKGKLLGKGSFGSAWLCTSKLDANSYVIKEVDISRMPRAEREAAEQEAKVRCLPLNPAAAVQQTVYCLAVHAVMLPSSCSLHPSSAALWHPSAVAAVSIMCWPAAAAGAQAPQHRALQGMLHIRLKTLHRHGLVQRG
jgi:serine/threonine protein kinase